MSFLFFFFFLACRHCDRSKAVMDFLQSASDPPPVFPPCPSSSSIGRFFSDLVECCHPQGIAFSFFSLLLLKFFCRFCFACETAYDKGHPPLTRLDSFIFATFFILFLLKAGRFRLFSRFSESLDDPLMRRLLFSFFQTFSLSYFILPISFFLPFPFNPH